jgi:hypothetical protein
MSGPESDCRRQSSQPIGIGTRRSGWQAEIEDQWKMRLVSARITSDYRPEVSAPTSEQMTDVTCRALHLALSAVRLQMAWHAGVISGDAAMEALGREMQAGSHGMPTAE